jgi:hypothetical protein
LIVNLKPETIAKAVRASRPPRNVAKAYNEYLLNACRSTVDWDANERSARVAALRDELNTLQVRDD